MSSRNRGLKIAFGLMGLMLFFVAGTVHAQLVAVDDVYGVPFGEPLLVEALGVLKNDTLVIDGTPETDFGGTAVLLTDVANGTLSCPNDGALKLCADGSFDYLPGAGFNGSDSFTYRATDIGSAQSDTATVTLTACSGGPDIFSCWKEAAFRSKLAELGYSSFLEGFEGAAWAGVRSSISGGDFTAPEIISQGIAWTTNHPATNDITTGSGAARSGEWGAYDPNHGVATGTTTLCDVDTPPPECLFHDGLSGSVRPSGNPLHSSLHGVGGYISGTTGSNVGVILDGGAPVVIGKLPDPGYQFFGLIDASAGGFTSFSFEEQDGKIGQERFIFGDDFIIATSAPCLAAGYGIPANTWTKFAIPCNAAPNHSVESIFVGGNTDSLVTAEYEVTWVVYSRNASAEEYVPLTIGDTLTEGVGYWVFSINATTVGVSGVAQSFDDIDLIGVAGGRDNYLGHKQVLSVDWNRVQVVDGVEVFDYGQYGALMDIEMNKWNGAAYQVFNGDDQTGTAGALDPFDGYWVYAFKPGIKLRVPAGVAATTGEVIVPAAFLAEGIVSTTVSGSTKAKKPKKPRYQPWFIRLTASAGDMQDPGNVFGQQSTAVAGNDTHDLEEPAPFGSKYLSILFTNPLFEQADWGYTTDFHALTKYPRGTWPFVVKAHAGISRVTIRWDGKDELFKGAQLVNEANGEVVRARAGGSYTFDIEDGEGHFRFEVRVD